MSSILSQASSRCLGYFGKSTIDLTYGNSKSSIKSQLLVRAKLTTWGQSLPLGGDVLKISFISSDVNKKYKNLYVTKIVTRLKGQ